MRNVLLPIPAIVALLASSPALAQHLLFEDEFSNGVSEWTTQPPWHWAQANDPCTNLSNPPPSYGAMARLGDPDCTFNSIDQSVLFAAQLQVANYLLIPADAVNPRLEFDSYIDSEACIGFDFHWVFLSLSGGSPWKSVGGDCVLGSWHPVSMDLSPWVGQQVRIGFELAALNGGVNSGLGWLIDNVRIEADCASQQYCVAAANSVSPTGAIIGHTGSLSLTQNNFALTLQDGPPGQFALFFYGPFQTQVPVAQGFLCVGADLFGYRRLHPPGQIDANGNVAYPIDFTALTGSHILLPSTEVNFQCWYRDIVGGLSTANFSDAQSITFCP